jgi:adenosyl cobinamide kinase/adenosyl cobinamide phosphate guanylyltransferase
MVIKKALTVANVQAQKITRIQFEGAFYQAYRQPQNKGVWFIWGPSSSGKSSKVMQLAKELARYERVFYNLLEEETDDSDFIERVELNQMNDVKDNFLVGRYNLEEMTAYAKKRNPPKVIIIDSATYFFKNFAEYQEFKNEFKNRIIIITGHAQGANPRSELEKDIRYDAKQKIFVSAYQSICQGRTIGPNGGLFTIWQEGYEKARGVQTE